MDPKELEARLARLDEQFKNASSEGSNFDLPEPGTYQAILRSVDFFEAKADGTAFLKIAYEIVFDTVYAGRNVEMVYNLEPQGSAEQVEQKLGFLKRDLKRLGIDVDSEDFSLTMVRPGSAIWDEVLDVPVEITIKDSKKINETTGKPYRNAYLDARTGDPLPKGSKPLPPTDVPAPAEEPVAATAGGDDDDIPF